MINLNLKKILFLTFLLSVKYSFSVKVVELGKESKEESCEQKFNRWYGSPSARDLQSNPSLGALHYSARALDELKQQLDDIRTDYRETNEVYNKLTESHRKVIEGQTKVTKEQKAMNEEQKVFLEQFRKLGESLQGKVTGFYRSYEGRLSSVEESNKSLARRIQELEESNRRRFRSRVLKHGYRAKGSKIVNEKKGRRSRKKSPYDSGTKLPSI